MTDAERLAATHTKILVGLMGSPEIPDGTLIGEMRTMAMQALIDQKLIIVIDPDEKHLIQFTEFGWTIQHPALCRLEGQLFRCPLTLAASELQWAESWDGTWICQMSDDGERMLLRRSQSEVWLERVPDEEK